MFAGVDPLVLVGLVLLVLLAILSWLTRRLQGGGSGVIGSRERVVLTSQHAVHVVELGGLRLLVGTGPSGAPRVLAQLGEVEVGELVQPARGGRAWGELIERLGVVSGR